MASQSRTAFVLVPGSFSPPLYYHKVSERLRAKGHEVTEISLRTCVQDRTSLPAATMFDDAVMLKETIEGWADKGYEVVVAMNSYGGFPGSESVKGLGKAERAQNGQKAGVVGLVYLASFLPRAGESVVSLMGDSMPDQLKNPEGEYMELSKEGGGKWIFNSLPEQDADHYISKVGYHSRQSYSDGVTYAGWMDIPTTYVYTGNDYGLPPAIQKQMVETARKEGADIKLIETEADHVPMLSIPDEVTRALLESAGKA